MHGEEVVIGGDPTEAQVIVDKMNEEARDRRIGYGAGNAALYGAEMDPRSIECEPAESHRLVRYTVDI